MGGISFLYLWLKDSQIKLGILTALILGSVIGFKVHTGILVLCGLAWLSFYFFINKKLKNIILFLLTAAFSFIVFFPVNGNSKPAVFSPFEISRNFVVQPKINLSHFELARQIYNQHNNFLQSIKMDLTMLVLFLLAEFGIRNIGWIGIRSFINKTSFPFAIFIYSGAISSIIFASTFIQPVAHADIFNSFLAASLLLSIPAALFIGNMFSNKKLMFRIILIVLILLVTLPRWIYKTTSFQNYFKANLASAISSKEIEAMQYIQDNTPSGDTVLVFNKGNWDSLFPYVSVFTQRDMYLSGQIILGRHGIPYEDREKTVKKILSITDANDLKDILTKEKINLLYFYGNPNLKINTNDIPLKKIFDNKVVAVYQQ